MAMGGPRIQSVQAFGQNGQRLGQVMGAGSMGGLGMAMQAAGRLGGSGPGGFGGNAMFKAGGGGTATASFGGAGGAGGGLPASFTPGGQGGGGNAQLGSLFAAQMQQNNAARQQNQANWDSARGGMLGVQSNYAADPTVAGTRGLVNQMLADPEALNDRTAQAIRNRAGNQIQARSNNSLKQRMGMMAAGGALDAGTLQAMQEKSDNSAMAEEQNVNLGLDVQRANQRNADIRGAIGAGQSMSGQDYGVQMDVNRTIMQNLPQVLPDDLSGFIAGINQGNGGMGGGAPGGGGQYGAMMGGAGGGGAPGGMTGGAPGGGFTGFRPASMAGGMLGFTRPKPQSTGAGFNWSTPQADGSYQSQGVDPMASGGFGMLGGGESVQQRPVQKPAPGYEQSPYFVGPPRPKRF